jgi:hypothetical protein
MFYLTLKKNYNYKFSYILVVMNSKRRVIRKLGVFSYNKFLNLFVFTINFMLLVLFLKNDCLFSKKTYIYLYKYINFFLL